jgi:2-polyprenyl-6-methoxyphenol hydroxylase-like FAD-dependent oxidoreductase
VHCLEDVVEVETARGTYRARAVVGADGATGVVRRAVARRHTPRVSRLLEVLVPADRLAPASPDPGEGQVLLDFSCMADGVQGYV